MASLGQPPSPGFYLGVLLHMAELNTCQSVSFFYTIRVYSNPVSRLYALQWCRPGVIQLSSSQSVHSSCSVNTCYVRLDFIHPNPVVGEMKRMKSRDRKKSIQGQIASW